MRSDIDLLLYVKDEMSFVVEHSRGMSRDAFLENETLKRAFSRRLEIIGEAAKT